jgi:RNA polymerase sigma-70 factor (family 1)
MHLPYTILLDEREYFIRIAHGDEVAFSKIFFHYTSRIHPFIRKITRSEDVTEEIVQDVFVSLWKSREKLMEIDNYAAYIFTIATNKTYNYLKAKARKEKHLNELCKVEKDFTNNTMESIELHEIQQLVSSLVRQLTPQKKMIFKLTREEGLSHDKIAQQLNISKNTVKNHLVETLKFLRENLQRSQCVALLLINIFSEICS